MSRKHKIVALACAVVLFTGVLWIATRWFVHARAESARASCISVLKQIEGAKASWALEHKKERGDIPTWSDLVGPGRYLADIPVCPQGGVYTLRRVDEQARCSLPGRDHSLASLESTNKIDKKSSLLPSETPPLSGKVF